MVIWLVGLSGSGKTTVGLEVFRQWRSIDRNTVLVDGDDVRRMMQHDTGPQDYTIEARRLNARRIVEICSWLDRQGINVICCILCLFDDIMQKNSRIFSQYFQTYLHASMDLLRQRDPKGLYRRAAQGREKNVVGLDIPFFPPKFSDLVIRMDATSPSPKDQARSLLTAAGVKP